MKVQFKDTPRGEVAILPRAEYDRLILIENEAVEDEGTARLVRKARKEIAKGAVLLPLKIVNRLIDGENSVRVLREFRGMTQAELAASEGVQITQNYLSDLENGKRKGPLALHRKLARALNIPLDVLISDDAADETARRVEPTAKTKRMRAK